jgi:uncharacterized protein YcgL (UPF0745 family)
MGVFDILTLLILLLSLMSERYSEDYQACYSHYYIQASNHPLIQSKSMFCVIYRSSRREQTYLYVEKKDDFSRVPEELMKSFGQPQLAMLLPLDGRKKLASAEKVRGVKLFTDSPPPENLLKQHLDSESRHPLSMSLIFPHLQRID